MATPNNSSDLVALPRLTVPELLSLMRQLETEATALQKSLKEEGKPLPDSLMRALGRVVSARDELDKAYGTTPPPPPTKRAADHKMDTAWRAVEAFLKGLSLLQPHHNTGPKEAAAIYALWFEPDGLRFITIAPELEYEETKKRLKNIEDKNLLDTLHLIGGTPFWSDLTTAFAEYGHALHITSPREAPLPTFRPLWDKSQETIRQYVTKVIALEEPEMPETLVYIKTLLAPLKEWEQKTASTPSAPAETTPTNPTAPQEEKKQ